MFNKNSIFRFSVLVIFCFQMTTPAPALTAQDIEDISLESLFNMEISTDARFKVQSSSLPWM